MQKGKSDIAFKIFILLFVTMLLSGCHKIDRMVEASTEGSDTLVSTTEFDFLDDADTGWKDNTLDEMYAVLKLPVRMTEAEGEIKGAGTAGSLVGEAGCALFRIHVFGSGSWSGVNGYTLEGEEFSCKLELEEDPRQGVVHGIGAISGSKGYVASKWMQDGESTGFMNWIKTLRKFEAYRWNWKQTVTYLT